MSDYTPNTFQVPNIIVDELMAQLTEKEFKCLILIIRKTRGWGKELDSISVSQFKKFTGINRDKTIHKTLADLIEKKLARAQKVQGKITRYGLGERFDQGHLVPVAPSATSGTFEPKPVAPSATATSGTRCHPTKPTIQNPITKRRAREAFKESYPQQVKALEIDRSWDRWDEQFDLTGNIDSILADIERRKREDRRWREGYAPDPVTYITGARWNDQIIADASGGPPTPSEFNMPRSDQALVAWAEQHGYPPPYSGEDWEPYRARLWRAVGERQRQAS